MVLDLETTGRFNSCNIYGMHLVNPPRKICEIAAIEFDENYRPCSFFHQYVDPVKRVGKDAEAVHGLTNSYLRGFPRFHVIANLLSTYIKDSELYAHGADNDRGWLDSEFHNNCFQGTAALGCSWVDTLSIARKIPDIKRPGLDGLCYYYGMDESLRYQHSALTDCALLLSILPLMEGHEEMGMEPEDICRWIENHKEENVAGFSIKDLTGSQSMFPLLA